MSMNANKKDKEEIQEMLGIWGERLWDFFLK